MRTPSGSPLLRAGLSRRSQVGPCARCSLDYGRLPVSALLRGPLLHTPQGLAVVFWTVAYLAAAGVVWLFHLSPPFGKTLEVFFAICLVWPFVVFLTFIRDSKADFRSSWVTAAWVAFHGALPLFSAAI